MDKRIIQDEIVKLSKLVRDTYAKRFMELEELVPYQLNYVRIVNALGNDLSTATIQERLKSIVEPGMLITIGMAAASNEGEDLLKDEMEALMKTCSIIISLEESRNKITEFVKQNMIKYAPNITAVVGSSIAAKLIGAAGGLEKLSQMSSANLKVLGRQRTVLGGFSASNISREGFIRECDIVARTPANLEVRILRQLANKCTLAARIDGTRNVNVEDDGVRGKAFREDIERKLEKWMQPAPRKKVRALKAPDMIKKKKRGGRRARQLKEEHHISELRKRSMRVAFGESQTEIGNSMVTLGSLGSSGKGAMMRIGGGGGGDFKRRKGKISGDGIDEDHLVLAPKIVVADVKNNNNNNSGGGGVGYFE